MNFFFDFPGYVRDKTDYVITLHFLNLMTYFVTICWVGEKFYRDYQERKQKCMEKSVQTVTESNQNVK